ncbi:MAG: hypothetical protein QNL62_12600 [Gammaproteobacteria bacterium]|nr:hypothetical protein [Gammaproteobacteria bacterium]
MLKKFILLTLMVLFISACQTHLPVVSESISCAETSQSIASADSDYLLYANMMVDSLIQDKKVQKETAVGRMELYLYPVSNNSNESIDMAAVNRAIKNRLLRSSKFIINDSNPESAESGTFQLSGSFDEIKQQTNNCSESYRQFSLKLMIIRTNSIFWSEKKRFH